MDPNALFLDPGLKLCAQFGSWSEPFHTVTLPISQKIYKYILKAIFSVKKKLNKNNGTLKKFCMKMGEYFSLIFYCVDRI